jgi:hypothetical protein
VTLHSTFSNLASSDVIAVKYDLGKSLKSTPAFFNALSLDCIMMTGNASTHGRSFIASDVTPKPRKLPFQRVWQAT